MARSLTRTRTIGIVLCAVAMLLWLLPAAPTVAEVDSAAPVLVDLDFVPKTVDITSGPASFDLFLHVTDDAAGVDAVHVRFISPSGSDSVVVSAQPGDLVLGDDLDGHYESQVTIPQFTEPGTWTIGNVTLYDNINNQHSLSEADLIVAGFPTLLTVVGPPPDVLAPVLVDLDFVPKTVDITSGPASFDLFLHVTDDAAGVDAVHVRFISPSGSDSVVVSAQPGDLVLGDDLDGHYESQVTIPQFTEPGTWTIGNVTLYDNINNQHSLSEADLIAAGFPTLLTVVGPPPDVLAPVLVDLDFVPKTVDITSGPASFDLFLHVTDDAAGVDAVHVRFISPSGSDSVVVSAQPGDLVLGDDLDGHYESQVTIPQFTEPGTWTIGNVTLYDNINNQHSLSEADLIGLGYPTELTVTEGSAPSATDDAFATDEDTLLTVSRAGMLGLWKLDEGAGGVAGDVSGNGNDGTITGAAWVPSPHGTALQLDGVNDHVQVPDDPSLDFGTTTDFSMELWVNTTSGGNEQYGLIRKNPNPPGYGMTIGFGPFADYADKVVVYVDNWVYRSNTAGLVNDGQWRHVAAVVDRDQGIRIYVDGQLDADHAANTTTRDTANGSSLYIGSASSASSHLAGTVDEVAVYGRALTPAEVAAHAQFPPTGSVLDNDTDPDGDPLSAILDADAAHGTLSLEADGSFTYDPDPDFFGTDTFTYHADDGALGSNVATVTITVKPVNDAPAAVDDGYVTAPDTTLVAAAPGVLDNDSDPDADPLSAVLDTDVANGTLALDPDGSFTYDPDPGFRGTDTFRYLADDGTTGSNVATVTIAVNRPPTAIDDGPFTTDSDTPLPIPSADLLVNDTDPDGDPLAIARVDATPDTHGTVALDLSSTSTTTLAAGLDDPIGLATDATHLYFAEFGRGGGTHTIQRMPLTGGAAEVIHSEGVTLSELGRGLAVDATHVYFIADFNTIARVPLAGGAAETLAAPGGDISGIAVADGNVYYTFDNHTIGTGSVRVVPVTGGTSTTLVGGIGQPIGIAVAGGYVYYTDYNGGTAHRVPVGGGTAESLATGLGSPFEIEVDGTYLYVSDYNGFSSGGRLLRLPIAGGTVETLAEPVTVARIAIDDHYLWFADNNTNQVRRVPKSGGPVQVVATGFDALMGIHVRSGRAYVATTNFQSNDVGTVEMVEPVEQILYTPDQGYFGPASFTYAVTDGQFESPPATVSITVNVGNRPPVAVDDGPFDTEEGIALVIPPAALLANDTDPDGDPLTVAHVDATPDTHGTVAIDAASTTTTLASGATQIRSLATDGTHVYFAEYGQGSGADRLRRVPLAGGPAELLHSGDYFQGVDVDATHVYFIAGLGGLSIQRVPRAGGAAETLVTYSASVTALAVSGGNVYYTYYDANGTVNSIPVTGGAPTVLAGADQPVGVAASDGWVYFADNAGNDIGGGTVKRIPMAGGAVEVLITGLTSPHEVTVDDAYVYVSEHSWQTVPRIVRAPRSGGAIEVLVDGSNMARLAVDETYLWFTDVLPAELHRMPKSGGASELVADSFSGLSTVRVQDGNAYVPDYDNGTGQAVVKRVEPAGVLYTPNAGFYGTASFTYADDDGELESAPATVTVDVAALPDGDGIPPEVEDGAPNGGDGNSDGIPDRVQPNVASLPNALDARYLTIEAPPGIQILNVTVTDNPSPGPLPPGTDFPVGFVGFELEGLAPGAAAPVTLYVPEAGLVEYFRYGPEPGDASDHWYLWAFDGTTGATSADLPPGTVYTLSYVDGERGDADLAADGRIVDPGGPALLLEPPAAVADPYTVDEDTQLAVAAPGVLGNDTGSPPLTAVLDTDVSRGTLALAADGSFTYDPDPGFAGTDSFSYVAENVVGQSAPALVTITVDQVPDGPDCTVDADGLAEFVTIGDALADAGCDTITVDGDTFVENLTVDRNVTIDGFGAGATVIDGSAAGSVLTITAGEITITDVSIVNGDAPAGGGIVILAGAEVVLRDSRVELNSAGSGGGIHNDGWLRLVTTAVTDNTVTLNGGGIYNAVNRTLIVEGGSAIMANHAAQGGGIYNYRGTVTVQGGSEISGNHADVSDPNGTNGGGIYNRGPGGPVTLDGAFVLSNTAAQSGGGLYSWGPITIRDTLFDLNHADHYGGGVYSYFDSGTAIIEDSVFSANTAGREGGGLNHALKDLEIRRTTFTANQGRDGGGMYIANAVSLIEDVTATGNQATDDGGGMWLELPAPITLTRVDVNSNAAFGHGGGIVVADAADVTMVDSTVRLNQSVGSGGGIALHGGIRGGTPSLTLTATTVDGNWADGAGGGLVVLLGTASVENATISGNHSEWSGGGGWVAGSASLDSVTVADNTAPHTGGMAVAGGSIEVRNTIIATNQAPVGPDCYGTFASYGWNLIGDSLDCDGFVDGVSGDILEPAFIGLGPLADNGGPTETHLPLPGSPAIDSGDTLLAVDQRGEPRPQGGGDDRGAVEIANLPPTADPDDYDVDEDTLLDVAAPGVLGNDDDPEGLPMVAVLDSDAQHGTLDLLASGAFTYTADENWNGTDTFAYRAFDGVLSSSATLVTIRVNSVPDAPEAADDEACPAFGALPGTVILKDFEGGTAHEAHGPTPPAASMPGLGDAIELLTGSWIKYTPQLTGLDPEGTVEMWVRPVAHPASFLHLNWYNVDEYPSSGKVFHFNTQADGRLHYKNWHRALGTGEVWSDAIVPLDRWSHFAVTWGPDGVILYLNGQVVGSLPDNHPPDMAGNGVYGYLNYFGDSDLGAVDHVSISAAQRSDDEIASHARCSPYVTAAGGTIVADPPGVLGNDTDGDGDPLTALPDTPAADGVEALAPDGGFTYTPPAGYFGYDTFTYLASDGGLTSAPAKVIVQVLRDADPRFAVSLNTDQVFAFGWEPGATATITVDDPANGTGVDHTDVSPVEPDGSFAHTLVFDLAPDHLVTVSDGFSAKDHVVVDLSVTSLVTATDMVGGTGPPNTTVTASLWDGAAYRDATVLPDGTWTADFSVPQDGRPPYDIVHGEGIRAFQQDSDGDDTQWDEPASAYGDGYPDTHRIVRNGSDFEVWINGVRDTAVPFDPLSLYEHPGSGDDDTFVIDWSGGEVVPPGGIFVDGLAGFDELVLEGGSTRSVDYLFDGPSDGRIVLDGARVVTFAGLEPITDRLAVDERGFGYTATSDQVTLEAGGLGGPDPYGLLDADTAESVLFRVPAVSLGIDLGGGDDQFDFLGLEHPAVDPSVTIFAGSGHDDIDGFASTFDLTIDGGYGTDTLRGGQGDDEITTGDGDDYVTNSPGVDVVIGGPGGKWLDWSAFTGDTLLESSEVDGGTMTTPGGDSVAWTGMRYIELGPGDNELRFDDGWGLTGFIQGQTGTEIADFTAVAGPLTVELARFIDIEELVGNGPDALLIGPDQPTHWYLYGLDEGEVDGTTAFVDFGQFQGGSDSDEFVFDGTSEISGDLRGGPGDDVFRFDDLVAEDVVGLIDGEAGADTIDWTASADPLNAYLTGPGTVDEQIGTADNLLGGFDNVGALLGPLVPYVEQPLPDIEVDEDAPPTVIDLTGMFVDPNGTPLQPDVEGNSDESLVHAEVVGMTLTLTYLPDRNGSADIEIGVTDPDGLDAFDEFSVTVQPVNDAPVGDPDGLYVVQEGTALIVPAPGVLANDSDVEGDPLTLRLVTGAAHGRLTVAVSGAFVYVPDVPYMGLDSFTYEAFDGTAASAPIAVEIQVNGTYYCNGRHATIVGTNGDDLLVGTPGSDVIVGRGGDDGIQAGGGDDAVCPGLGDDVVDPGGGDDVILAGPGSDTVEFPGAGVSDVYLDGYNAGNSIDFDTPGSFATWTAVENLRLGPSDNVVQILDGGVLAGIIDGTAGNDSVDYSPRSAPVVVRLDSLIGVEEVFGNGPDALLIGRDVPTFWYLYGRDEGELDAFMYFEGFGRLWGGNAADEFVFDGTSEISGEIRGRGDDDVYRFDSPVPEVVAGLLDGGPGADTIDWSASAGEHTAFLAGPGTFDEQQGTADNLISGFDNVGILLGPLVPYVDRPLADVFVDEDAPPTVIDLTGVFVDPNGTPLQPDVEDNTDESLVLAEVVGMTLTLTYQADQVGAADIEIGVTDPDGLDAYDEFRVVVGGVNDAPVAVPDGPYPVAEGSVLGEGAPGVLGNDFDPDGDALVARLVSDVAHGTLALAPDGSFTYTPDVPYMGLDSFAYEAFDGLAASPPVAVEIQVTGTYFCSGQHATIVGTAGDDLLVGTARRDVIVGRGGADVIQSRGGNDSVCGGPGDDEIDGGTGDDVLAGEAGTDVVSYASAASAVVVNLPAGLAHGAGADTLTGFEDAVGSRQDDTLYGTSAANELFGGRGDDTLFGYGGHDTLIGGVGNDILIGGRGDDTLIGMPGFDTASYSRSPAPVVVNLVARTASGEGFDTLSSIEAVHGSRYDDELKGDGKDNTLVGDKGNDHLIGNGGNDELLGGRGDDQLEGGGGDDRLAGGPGTDTVSFIRSAAGVIADLVAGTATGQGNDILDDIIHLGGSRYADELYGNALMNVLSGARGDDFLEGRAGDDELYGDAGIDVASGSGGTDLCRAETTIGCEL